MNAGVTSQLIRTTESFCAAGELAGMRLLAGVSADVTSLMLESVKCAITQRTLVRTRKILSHFFRGRAGALHERW